MSSGRQVILMGLRGSGKSTLGRAVAARLETGFIDLDDRVLAGFEEPEVAEVWRNHGEAAWRAAELDALVEVLGHDGAGVIALGGGTPMIERARELLEAAQAAGSARLIYLRLDPEQLVERLADNVGDRPSLTGADTAEESRGVHAERDPVYSALADLAFEPGGDGVEADVERLLQLIERSGGQG